MKVIHVVGARPNFMKIAPIMDRMEKCSNIRQILVHTGQHYDEQMSKLFFSDLKIPEPDINLGVGSASHAVQTAGIMQSFEKILLEEKPDLVVVVGDVNSTIACALTSVKLGVSVAHVEAGLRSFDRTMPEEINRIVTDKLSDLLFTTEESANGNLVREGIEKEKMFFVGNVMIDTLVKFQEESERSRILKSLNINPGEYALLTLHRPSSVDEPERFQEILEALEYTAKGIQIIFPCHPRTRKQIQSLGFQKYFHEEVGPRKSGLRITDPLGYLDFLYLMSNSKFCLTDSGGIQEETTILGIPCLTLRENTERPATIFQGTNTLVGYSKEKIVMEASKILEGQGKKGKIPELWDGKAAGRIVDVILKK